MTPRRPPRPLVQLSFAISAFERVERVVPLVADLATNLEELGCRLEVTLDDDPHREIPTEEGDPPRRPTSHLLTCNG